MSQWQTANGFKATTLPRDVEYDAERAAVARLFQNPLLAAVNAASQHRYWDGRTLDAGALDRNLGVWSSGEQILAAVACSLWGYDAFGATARACLDPQRWCATLSHDSLLAVMEAIRIRAGIPIG